MSLHEELRPLPRLHRQMHWVYSGYVVLAIVAFRSLLAHRRTNEP